MTSDPQTMAVAALYRGHQARLKDMAAAELAVHRAVAQCRIIRPARRGHPAVEQATWDRIAAVLGQERRNAWRKYGPDEALAPLMRPNPGSVDERIAALDKAVQHLVKLRAAHDAQEVEEVRVCRAVGCSWTPISAALGYQHRKAAGKFAKRLQVRQTITVRPAE